MADTFTSSNRFTLVEPGTRNNTWGAGLNNEVFTLVDKSLDGYQVIDVSAGDVTLTTNNGSSDQARMRTLEIIGDITSARTINLPDTEKWYNVIVSVSGTGTVTIKNVSDTEGAVVSAGSNNLIVVCDGTSTKAFLEGFTQEEIDLSPFLVKASNLSDLTNVSAARDNLGLGGLANFTVSTSNIVVGTDENGDPAELTPSQGITVSSGTIKADVATTASAGIIEIATSAEVSAGTATDKAITPALLATIPLNTMELLASVQASGTTTASVSWDFTKYHQVQLTVEGMTTPNYAMQYGSDIFIAHGQIINGIYEIIDVYNTTSARSLVKGYRGGFTSAATFTMGITSTPKVVTNASVSFVYKGGSSDPNYTVRLWGIGTKR